MDKDVAVPEEVRAIGPDILLKVQGENDALRLEVARLSDGLRARAGEAVTKDNIIRAARSEIADLKLEVEKGNKLVIAEAAEREQLATRISSLAAERDRVREQLQDSVKDASSARMARDEAKAAHRETRLKLEHLERAAEEHARIVDELNRAWALNQGQEEEIRALTEERDRYQAEVEAMGDLARVAQEQASRSAAGLAALTEANAGLRSHCLGLLGILREMRQSEAAWFVRWSGALEKDLH